MTNSSTDTAAHQNRCDCSNIRKECANRITRSKDAADLLENQTSNQGTEETQSHTTESVNEPTLAEGLAAARLFLNLHLLLLFPRLWGCRSDHSRTFLLLLHRGYLRFALYSNRLQFDLLTHSR